MLQVEKLSKSYAGELLFENVCFSMIKGEKCALVGRNGSGKTTLFRILKGEETADFGTISYPKGYRMGFLDQHLLFKAPTVWEEALLDLPETKPEHEVEAILFGLGFDDSLLEKPPEFLSGGFHLRLKLAKVLAQEPNCLLLDEPTNYLDILSLRWLEKYLKNWKGECLLISHDRDFLNRIISHTMGLHRKTLRRVNGGLEHFYEKIVEEEEVYEKTRQSLEKKKEHLETYIRRFGAKASKATQAQSKAKALEKIPSLAKLSALENLCFSFQYTPFLGKNQITLKNVSYSYSEKIPLIQNVSLEIQSGKRIAIIGKNGMGKSTLLKLISGELLPQQGEYLVSDSVKMGIFGQTHILQLDLQKTIEDEIASANRDLVYGSVRAICGQMMFSGDAAKKKISLLSGGERSRVLLGKILATPTNCLLLDEPTHHLDLESIEALIQAIDEYEGTTILVTHSEWMLERFCPDILVVFEDNHQTIFLGNYLEFLEKRGWKEPVSQKPAKKAPPPRKPSSKPLEKEITKKEAAIETLEKDLQKLKADIEAAYTQNKTGDVTNLSCKAFSLEEQIEKLYIELSQKYEELERFHQEI